MRIYFHNNLAEDSVIHPHGLRVPEDCDGHPMQAIGPGETKIYEFQVIDRAGPYWFHPHPHMRTAEQVVMGLAGLFYVWDPEEELAVPGASTGANDLPVIIQDRTFDSNNQFLYQPNNMWGYLGNRILVNGKPNTVFSLEPRAYRLRFLNGSNARTYKLAWSNGMPLKVIGTDGGLLPAVASKTYVMLMPGERVDVWADFTQLAAQAGDPAQPFLRSRHGYGRWRRRYGRWWYGRWRRWMGGGGGGWRRHGIGLPMGSAFDILTVNVGQESHRLSRCLGPLPPLSVQYDASNVPNFATPRPFTLEMAHDGLDDQRARLRDDGGGRRRDGATAMIPWPGNGSTTRPSRTRCTCTTSSSRSSSGRLPAPAATPPSTRASSTAAGRIPCWSGRASGSRSP